MQSTPTARDGQLFPPQPGLENVCRFCRHLDAAMANQGHVAPCDRVRWVAEKHFSPDLRIVDGAVRCADREARV